MTDHKQHCYKITTWFHLRPRRKGKPHLAMKERGSLLPEHNETGEAECLIKREHLALGFCLGNRLRLRLDLRALRKRRRPRRRSCIVRPRKPEIWQDQELILTAAISSIFDYTTFFVMLDLFKCWAPSGAPLFQTGWFVESIMMAHLKMDQPEIGAEYKNKGKQSERRIRRGTPVCFPARPTGEVES